MIALYLYAVGTVEELDPNRPFEHARDLEYDTNLRKDDEKGGGRDVPKKRERNIMRGRSKIGKKLGMKMKNVVDKREIFLGEGRAKEMVTGSAMVGLSGQVGRGVRRVRGVRAKAGRGARAATTKTATTTFLRLA